MGGGGTHLRDACLISWHRGLALIGGGCLLEYACLFMEIWYHY